MHLVIKAYPFRSFFIVLLVQLFCLLPTGTPLAKAQEIEPLRLMYLGQSVQSVKAMECDQHASRSRPTPDNNKKKGRPEIALESEHRPLGKRIYYLNNYRRRASINAYVRRPGGQVIKPELRLGYMANVSFATPFGDGPAHGANNVYVVEQEVVDQVLTVRAAKWITMHHSCSWGHDGKFDRNLTTPQPLATIPLEIVIDNLWDRNFHLNLSSGDKLKVSILCYGQPVGGATVTLASEKGWTKRVTTSQDGTATIAMIRDYYPANWSLFNRSHRGEFQVTAQYNEEQSGEFRGQSYRRISYMATLPWQYATSARDYASYSHGLTLVVLGLSLSGFGVFIYRERRRKSYKGISLDE